MVERISSLVSLCYRLFPSDLYRLSCHKSVKLWSLTVKCPVARLPRIHEWQVCKATCGVHARNRSRVLFGVSYRTLKIIHFTETWSQISETESRKRLQRRCFQLFLSCEHLVNISFVNFLFTVRTSIQYWKHVSQIFSLTFDNSSIFLPRFQFLERLSQVTFCSEPRPGSWKCFKSSSNGGRAHQHGMQQTHSDWTGYIFLIGMFVSRLLWCMVKPESTLVRSLTMLTCMIVWTRLYAFDGQYPVVHALPVL